MKKILDRYNNDILELPLIVSMFIPLEDLNKDYCYSDGSVLDEELTKYSGSCCILQEIKTGKLVIFVSINEIPGYVKKYNRHDKMCWIINTIAHECYHAFMDTMKIVCDEPDKDHQELAAYYMGWLVECVYRSWIKSTKNKSDAKQ